MSAATAGAVPCTWCASLSQIQVPTRKRLEVHEPARRVGAHLPTRKHASATHAGVGTTGYEARLGKQVTRQHQRAFIIWRH